MTRYPAIAAIAILLSWAGEALADEGVVEIEVDVPSPELMVEQGAHRVRVAGAGAISRPGQPALPVKTIRVAIPPDADSRTVRVSVTPRDREQIAGRFDVRPAPPAAWIGNGELIWGDRADHIVDGRDTAVYGSSELYPDSWFVAGSGISAARRYRFVTVHLYPVRYRPAEGALVRAGGFDVEVRFDRGRSEARWRSDDCGADGLAARLLDNYQQARAWYPPECYGPPDGPAGLAIVTTQELADTSDLLDDYIEMRTDQGYEVTVATEGDWDFTTGDDLDERPDRIRLWLQENVEPLDLGWVLLIGNPDPGGNVANAIPMKKCGGTGEDRGPTDFYYADISGDWDSSGNGVVCEFGFDNLEELYGPGVDFVPELYVGRFPAYSAGASAVDDALGKTIAYEEESVSGDLEWRRRMMLPNSIYFFQGQYGQSTARWDGATVGEWFIRDQLGPRGMVWTTLYEHEGLDASQFESHFQVDTYNTVDQWVRGYGFVFWTGHGSSTGVYRSVWREDENDDQVADWQEMSSPEFMSTSYLHMLEDAPPTFVVHGSCSNGEPESASNLGYNLLRRGAIATLSASRPAMTWHFPDYEPEVWEKPEDGDWDGDVIDIVSDYAVNVLEGMEAGRALGETIADTTDARGSESWYQKSIQNLYGDPLVRLVMCREDSECENFGYCDGEELCDNGSCVPGTPVDCEAILGCEDVTCDDALGCLLGPSCGDPADAGPGDGGPPDQTASVGSGSAWSCDSAPSARRASRSLLAVLVEAL